MSPYSFTLRGSATKSASIHAAACRHPSAPTRSQFAIGAGGWASVSRDRHDPRAANGDQGIAGCLRADAERLARLSVRRDTRILNHPNLPIYGLENSAIPALSSWSWSRRDLSQRIAGGRFRWPRRSDCEADCRGARGAHEQGIIHRDLNPRISRSRLPVW